MLGFRIGYILFPIVIVLGFAGFFAYRYVRVQKTTPFLPQPSSTILEPPKQAVTGILTLVNGSVTQKTRQSDEFREASAGGKILQGESVATKLGSATISFEPIGTVFMGNQTELAAVNLVPGENVFLQKSGTVQYEAGTQFPLSVRALHSLSEISGNTTITILGTSITVRVTEGTTKLALVDQNNDTKVWTVNMGHQADIDDVSRNVTVR